MRLVASATTIVVGVTIFAVSITSVMAANESSNNIKTNENKISLEQESVPKHEAKKTQNKVVKEAKKTMVVKPGDTLSIIAKKYGTTYERIFYANKSLKNPDLIYPGNKLVIPSKDEKLAKRPLPSSTPVVVQTQPVVSYYQSAPAPAAKPSSVVSGNVWDRLAACESGGNWQINTGNGYYGGLQFNPNTWRSVGGSGLPHQHSREEQIKRGQILQARSGWGQWPACAAKLGLI